MTALERLAEHYIEEADARSILTEHLLEIAQRLHDEPCPGGGSASMCIYCDAQRIAALKIEAWARGEA